MSWNMDDDKVNMALDDIIRLNKRRRGGNASGRGNNRGGQRANDVTSAGSRGRGGFAQRRGARFNNSQRRGARSEPVQRQRAPRSESADVAAVNNAATRRFVKNLVNKTLQKMRAKAATAVGVANPGAIRTVRADAAIARVSARSRGIRKRVVEVPRVIVRRARARPVHRQLLEEESGPVVYQTVRVVREPRPLEVVRTRPAKIRRGNRGGGARVLQNARSQLLPVRRVIQPQQSPQIVRQRGRAFVQQPVRVAGGFVKRVPNYLNGNARQNPRSNVIYVNDEMSARVQSSARGGVRFAKRQNRQYRDYEDEVDEYERFPSTSSSQRNRIKVRGNFSSNPIEPKYERFPSTSSFQRNRSMKRNAFTEQYGY